ncbi:MAG TPA: hypothetical protein VNX70_06255, partial [Bryobacteraceae bacterium]|nr:hypothetical protein [Bryobacteraceae bacterium]
RNARLFAWCVDVVNQSLELDSSRHITVRHPTWDLTTIGPATRVPLPIHFGTPNGHCDVRS